MTPTVGFAPISAKAGGQNKLKRSSLQTAVGTTLKPRRNPPDATAQGHYCDEVWKEGASL